VGAVSFTPRIRPRQRMCGASPSSRGGRFDSRACEQTWNETQLDSSMKDARLTAEPWRRHYATGTWKRVRELARKRAGGCCERCGCERKLEVHHRVPLRHGGAPFDLSNVEAICRRCHRLVEKGVPRSFKKRPSTTSPVEISPPGVAKREEPSRESRDNSKEHGTPRDNGTPRRGWWSPSGTGPCSRQWAEDYFWVGPGEPPPGTALADRSRQ
jgi:5-methylcytosine-specific restriction endonuclease McrA